MSELVIERRVHLNASPERVWRALTDPEQVASWFPDDASWNLRAGARGSMTWENHGTYEVDIVEVEELRRFVWRWPRGDGRAIEEYSTLVEWTLEPQEDGTTVLFVRESGFEDDAHYNDNVGGWKHELGELESFLAA